MKSYAEFLASKGVATVNDSVPHGEIHSALFAWQRKVCEWLLERGRAAAFLDTGLGKTITQCEWARQVPGDVLILAPLAVASQTAKEAQDKLGLEVLHSRDGSVKSKVTVANYERLHLFDLSRFAGVVLDESSILKSFMGKTKQALCEGFANTRWRLACTATPAPNDHMELGNHSQFLGVMPSTEMLARWFINDPSAVGTYRLKGHAEADFWAWVGSWAACVGMPSDVGGDDAGYKLPGINFETHIVETPLTAGGEGELFAMAGTSATDLHKTKRLTVHERCRLVAEMVNKSSECWVVWCESNEESAALVDSIPDAVEVKGSDSVDVKEDRLNAFSEGRARVLVSKPSICGFGMNWQHCANTAFASISYSYESFYQAVRRFYRFGQTRTVNVHVVISDAEIPVWATVQRKAEDHNAMKRAMLNAVMSKERRGIRGLYRPKRTASLPSWLKRKEVAA